MAVLGQRAMGWLESDQSQVSLIVGPRSVGKWTAAETLRHQNKILDSDLLRVTKLSMDVARNVVLFCSSAPVGEKRMVIMRLDEATPEALHVLLKTLEELSPKILIVMTAEESPPLTFLSRCHTYQFTLLSREDIAQILMETEKMTAIEARTLSALSAGSVRQALEARSLIPLKNAVQQVLRAFEEHDGPLLEAQADRWTEAHTELLSIWCAEFLTKQWRLFSEEDSNINQRPLAVAILSTIRADIRPKLVIRASLMNLLKGQR